MTGKKDEALKLALEWYDSGKEDRQEFETLMRRLLAEQPAQNEPPTVAELICVCGAEWEWRNREWELVATPPAQQEPVAWMFQHEETGRTMCVDAQQVEWGFEKGNPRLKKIAPLYTSSPASKPFVGLTDEEKERIRNTWGLGTYKAIEDVEAKLREKNA